MKSIAELSLSEKKVLIRCDLDLPLDEQGQITDDHRLAAGLDTIHWALKSKAQVIVAGHLGRPKGKRDEKLSLAPIAKHLGELLQVPVHFVEDCVGPNVEKEVSRLKGGQVLVLENVRFHEGEEKNDPDFAKALASHAEAYVNNAFATAHRAHASCVAITRFFKHKAAGFTLIRELEFFSKALEKPALPLAALFGGAKVSTKMKAIRFVGAKAQRVVVGGAMANTFFVARGLNVGKSLYEKDQVAEARATEELLKQHQCELFLPTDVVVAPELKAGVRTEVVAVTKIPEQMMVLDIGPRSIEQICSVALAGANTIIWNGPMGAFEIDEFSAGTYAIVDALAQAKGLTVVGGGDTDLALERRQAMDKMDFVSTGGGAFLELLEGKTLPAIAALEA